MDTSKLKIEKFKNINFVNFPREMISNKNFTEKDVEAIIYYIDKLEDISKFGTHCNSSNLTADNPTIMIYKKGRKDGVNRDSIFMPYIENKFKGFKLKAPMLCSISDELSACVRCKGHLYLH